MDNGVIDMDNGVTGIDSGVTETDNGVTGMDNEVLVTNNGVVCQLILPLLILNYAQNPPRNPNKCPHRALF